jgi:hypothetical protein
VYPNLAAFLPIVFAVLTVFFVGWAIRLTEPSLNDWQKIWALTGAKAQQVLLFLAVFFILLALINYLAIYFVFASSGKGPAPFQVGTMFDLTIVALFFVYGYGKYQQRSAGAPGGQKAAPPKDG